MSATAFLRKVLTANDVGATGSHQAGLHVPRTLIDFFPVLSAERPNPDVWLDIHDGGSIYRWRYIYYNNGLTGQGTRDEFRLTHTDTFLRDSSAQAGDQLELTRLDLLTFRAKILPAGDYDSVVILSTAGPWKLVRLGGASRRP